MKPNSKSNLFVLIGRIGLDFVITLRMIVKEVDSKSELKEALKGALSKSICFLGSDSEYTSSLLN